MMIYHSDHKSVLESSQMWVEDMKVPINNKLHKQVSSPIFLVICYEVRYFGEQLRGLGQKLGELHSL